MRLDVRLDDKHTYVRLQGDLQEWLGVLVDVIQHGSHAIETMTTRVLLTRRTDDNIPVPTKET